MRFCRCAHHTCATPSVSATSSGSRMSKQVFQTPDWEDVLSSAARLQSLLPGAVLVGGSASALYAAHRVSFDHDHVLTDLKDRYEEVLADLESVSGWKTKRISYRRQILGHLDGIQTGVRQLIRSEPLETTEMKVGGLAITVPTPAEVLRIKGFLILVRNATRDYVDFAALGDHLGSAGTARALSRLDELYPQESGESPLQQLFSQIASPQPHDLNAVDLSNFKGLDARWHSWNAVAEACESIMLDTFRNLAHGG